MSTIEERIVARDIVALGYLTEQLYAAAMQRQNEILDANFMQLIGDGRVLKRVLTSPVMPIFDACLLAIDELWDEYKERKDNSIYDLDFSALGSISNTYSELRTELESL